MILTLRTLLAWLDDTASLPDCEEIGRLVAESPAALQLVGRIYEVMQGDRHDPGVDYGVVCDYLDNQMDPIDVAAFETSCFESDALLAEVVDAHRILSFMGKKAQFPVKAKPRMYQLDPARR